MRFFMGLLLFSIVKPTPLISWGVEPGWTKLALGPRLTAFHTFLEGKVPYAKRAPEQEHRLGVRFTGTRKGGRRSIPAHIAKGIGDRIKRFLDGYEIGRKEFGTRLGYDISRKSHSKRVTNLRAGRLDTTDLLEICETFGISADYLLFGKEPKAFGGLAEVETTAVNEAVRAAVIVDLVARDFDPAFVREQVPQDPVMALRDVVLDRIRWETAACVAGLPSTDVKVVLVEPRRTQRVKSTAVPKSSLPAKGSNAAIAEARKRLAQGKRK